MALFCSRTVTMVSTKWQVTVVLKLFRKKIVRVFCKLQFYTINTLCPFDITARVSSYRNVPSIELCFNVPVSYTHLVWHLTKHLLTQHKKNMELLSLNWHSLKLIVSPGTYKKHNTNTIILKTLCYNIKPAHLTEQILYLSLIHI